MTGEILTLSYVVTGKYVLLTITLQFHPYRPVWYIPDQGMDYTILDT